LEGIRRRPALCLEASLKPSREALTAAGCFAEREPHSLELALRPSTWRTQLSELDTLFDETSEQAERAQVVLRDIPAVLLTASPTGRPAGADNPAAMAWEEIHRRDAANYVQSDVQLVKSSHLIMIDRPDVVTAAILRFVKPGSAPHDVAR
jgi:hypothetical protein